LHTRVNYRACRSSLPRESERSPRSLSCGQVPDGR
jgi:hypothetical protein